MSKPTLTRGWTEPELRQALRDGSDNARAVLGEIAEHGQISTAEIAENLSLKSPASVRSIMAQWSQVTGPLGVLDPVTGLPSWPITFPGKRGGYGVYEMSSEVARIVLDEVGRSRRVK